jgi:hypothetical protein
MRNIAEYPADAEEVAAILNLIKAGYDATKFVGSIHPYVIDMATSFILSRKDDFDEYARKYSESLKA